MLISLIVELSESLGEKAAGWCPMCSKVNRNELALAQHFMTDSSGLKYWVLFVIDTCQDILKKFWPHNIVHLFNYYCTNNLHKIF